ncbi:MAG: hypothetical protein ACI9QC_000496 [Oceanicoccus sp.]|jgi:hypothetical protein
MPSTKRISSFRYLVMILIVTVLSFGPGFGMWQGNDGSSLQSAFAMKGGGGPILSLTCSPLSSTSIFVDSTASPGGDGTFSAPYRGVVPAASHLLMDSSVETVCFTGHLYGTLGLEDAASSELTLTSYGGGATLEHAPGAGDYVLLVEQPSNLTSLTVSDLSLVGINVFEDLTDLNIKDVNVDTAGLSIGMDMDSNTNVTIENLDMSDSTEELLRIRYSSYLEMDNVMLAYGGQNGTDAALFLYDIDDVSMTEVVITDPLGKEGLHASQVDDISMSEVAVFRAANDAMEFSNSAIIYMSQTIIFDSLGSHIRIDDFTDFTIEDSYLYGSTYDSISADYGGSAVITSTTIYESGAEGIGIFDVESVDIYDNRIEFYTDEAIHINTAGEVLINSNKIQAPVAQSGSRGIKMRSVDVGLIKNNFIVDTERALYLDNNGAISFLNNSFSGNDVALYATSTAADSITSKNNAFYCVDSGDEAYNWDSSRDESISLDSDYNLFEGCDVANSENDLIDWQADWGYDTNSLEGIVFFISSSDLHIGALSDALGAGTPVGDVSTDIDGDARDASAPDIGADEA